MNVRVLNLAEDLLAYGTGSVLRCKFVIIRYHDELHLVFGALSDYPYHAKLVARFCDGYKVASAWVRRPDIHEVYDAECEIHGGGYLDINPADATATFWGRSTAYGTFSAGDLNEIVRADGFFSDYAVAKKSRQK